MSGSIYLVFGDDEYRVSQKARDLVGALVPETDRTLGLEIIDGRADTVADAEQILSRTLEAVETVGLFAGAKVVWLRDANFLSDTVVGRTERTKERVNALAAVLKTGLLPGQVLLVSAPRVDKRYTFYKVCRDAGEVHEFAVPQKGNEAEKGAAATLGVCLKKLGLQMPQEARTAFLDRVGTDTRQTVNEISKLRTYLGERRTVDRADVEAVVSFSRGAMAWDLADAFGTRDLKTCLIIVRRLLFQRESPIGLLMTLQARIRDLMIYREALDRRWMTIEEGYRGPVTRWGPVPADVEDLFQNVYEKDPRATHPFRIGILAGQARLFSIRELRRCQQAVREAHRKLVSSSIPEALAMELLLIRMLSPASVLPVS